MARAVRFVTVFCAAMLSTACGPAKPGSGPDAEGTTVDTEGTSDTGTPADSDAGSTITFENIADLPAPGTSTPGAIRFSPDGKLLTFLDSPDRSLKRELFKFDVESGKREVAIVPPGGGATEENLSEEEKLRRERMRMRGLGITRYAWAKESDRVLVPLTGDIYVRDGLQAGEEGELRKVVDTEDKPALDPRLSPDATMAAYVQDAELYVVDIESGKSKQLTEGARGTGKTHGLAEYVAQEEMGRYAGYWWSKDSKYLAVQETDETHIPAYRIVHQGKDAVGEEAQEDHGYPFAGAENAKVRLGVVAAAGGKTKWLDLRAAAGVEDDDFYLARVKWDHDGSLLVQVQNRAQSELRLVRFDPKTGKHAELLRDTSEVWINLNGDLHLLKEGEFAGSFVWGSEKSGFKHLYLHGADGKEVRALTSGEWMVDGVVDIDEAKGVVYFLGTKDGVRQRHLYSVPLAGGEVTKLSEGEGMHSVVFDDQFLRYVDVFSSPDQPPVVTLRSLESGKKLHDIHTPNDERIEKLDLAAPERVELKSRDGETLHAAIYKPDPARFGKGPYPTLVSVYGGPHVQRVTDSWGMTVDLRAQFLADHGYLVFKLDNRGSSRRGLAFEGAVRHDMGNVEVNDQVDGVKWLVDQGLADAERVGIFGWSYGGYMSAMALVRAPDTFKIAIAGAPVTHWDGYDTHYTERYMGTPQNNAEGYDVSAVMHHVDDMKGKLLLVHGLIDENVHFRHTARLIDALIRANKDYELLLFPNERHGPRRPADRVYLERRMFEFVRENL